jgi:hypothetical protein
VAKRLFSLKRSELMMVGMINERDVVILVMLVMLLAPLVIPLATQGALLPARNIFLDNMLKRLSDDS